MKRTIKLVGGLLIVSLILGACWPKKGSVNDMASKETGAEKVKGSLKDLLGLGKVMKCGWQMDEAGQKGEGVVYVANGKVKSEVSWQDETGENKAYSLMDGNWIYQWGSMMEQGTKMDIKKMEEMGKEMAEEETEDVMADNERTQGNYDDEFDYNCEGWRKDDKVFDLPSDIEFVDMTEQMEQAVEQAEEVQKDVCKMCESLPGQAKEECLKNC